MFTARNVQSKATEHNMPPCCSVLSVGIRIYKTIAIWLGSAGCVHVYFISFMVYCIICKKDK